MLLLADVFQNFRDICLDYYQLTEIKSFVRAQVELELITDSDMYLFIEEGLRGVATTLT